MNRVGARAFPLRKVVGQRSISIGRDLDGFEYFAQHEVLECGHTMRPRTDIYGETNANSRRCGQCAAEKRKGKTA